MPEEKVSAEKDLLKLIENPADTALKNPVISFVSKATPSMAAAVKVHRRFKMPNLKTLMSDRQLIIKALFGLTALVFVYFVFTIFHEYTFLEKARNVKNFESIKGAPRELNAVSMMIPSGEGQSGEDSLLRNVFKPFTKKIEEKKPVDDISTRLGDYKLVGISVEPDPNNSYAMIENTKNKTTVFVKKGDTLSGMELAEIANDRLIFKFGGQSVELR